MACLSLCVCWYKINIVIEDITVKQVLIDIIYTPSLITLKSGTDVPSCNQYFFENANQNIVITTLPPPSPINFWLKMRNESNQNKYNVITRN